MAATAEQTLLLELLQGFESLYLGVLAMGFFYGLTLCSLTCVPLITPYIFATQSGFRRGFDATAIFILARISAYTLWGALAGLFGELALERIDPAWAMALAGALVVLIAARVMLARHAGCPRRSGAPAAPAHPWRQMALLGLSTSLMPCLPLSAVLLYAAATQSALSGGLLALVFGIGASASPLYYIGGATGWLAERLRREIPRHSRGLRLLSGAILGLFGLRLLLTSGLLV